MNLIRSYDRVKVSFDLLLSGAPQGQGYAGRGMAGRRKRC